MKETISNTVRFTAFILLALLMLAGLNHLFLYRDKSIWSTDVRMKTYQELPENSIDILFLGSSNIMSGINPVQLWEETGIQSYNYCSRAQSFAFSYGYLTDALKTQSPECVVLDAYSVLLDKSSNGIIDTDFHFGINMDNLSPASRTELLKTFVKREEQLLYLFPLLKNHNYYQTWEHVEDETDQIFLGFCPADLTEPYETPAYTDATRPMDEIDRIYLEKIIRLCQEKEIDLFVIKTPVVCSDSYHSVLNDVKQMCSDLQVDYYDMSEDARDWGFDYSSDMMNEYHVNQNGARKVTARLGRILTEQYGGSVSDTRISQWFWAQESERMQKTSP